MAEERDCLACKKHAGVVADLDNIKRIQAERNLGIQRLWDAIEDKVSVRMFLGILSASVAIVGLIIGILFQSQSKMLTSLQASQSALQAMQTKVLDQMSDVRVDVAIIKGKIPLEGKGSDERH